MPCGLAWQVWKIHYEKFKIKCECGEGGAGIKIYPWWMQEGHRQRVQFKNQEQHLFATQYRQRYASRFAVVVSPIMLYLWYQEAFLFRMKVPSISGWKRGQTPEHCWAVPERLSFLCNVIPIVTHWRSINVLVFDIQVWVVFSAAKPLKTEVGFGDKNLTESEILKLQVTEFFFSFACTKRGWLNSTQQEAATRVVLDYWGAWHPQPE